MSSLSDGLDHGGLVCPHGRLVIKGGESDGVSCSKIPPRWPSG